MTLRVICFFVSIPVLLGAKLLNCPLNNIKYEKVIGVRPSNTNHPLLLLQKNNDANNNNFPITTECLAKCNDNDQCRSFVIYYNNSSCYWFKNTIQGVQETLNEIDPNVAWFVKICLNVGVCGKLWIFERVPGAILIGNETKSLPDTVTRNECRQLCLNETDFVCRSATFKISQSDYGPNDEIRGFCVLSDADRHIRSNSFRVSRYDEEYFENQCAPIYTNGDQFCAYEEFNNTTLSHRDLRYDKQTKESCQNLCDNIRNFHCRGYTFSKTICFLHSEDSKVLGPKSLLSMNDSKYYEKAQCLNVSITCSETYMTVDYLPKFQFGGKIYMQGYSEHPECFSQGSGFGLTTLKLPLLTNQCGIITATGTYNRTLKTGTMILQYNPFVQTQSDRVIRIGCIFNNDSKTVVGTGITITSNLSNTGTTLVNSSNSAKSPTIEMRVVDSKTGEEISDTRIGQDLQLIIEIKPADGNLDIWAGHLVAMTEKSDESILLLDDRGCPTNPNIFPVLTEISNNETRRLVAMFQAFKFSVSPVVRFSVIVQFCSQVCPTIICNNNVQPIVRDKRKIFQQPIQTIDSTKVTVVNRSEFEGATKPLSLPLEFIIVVRNPDARSDRLVFGDHKILVAGYDYVTNEVCLDYSLFIAITITWLLIQTIFVVCCLCLIKRYKRHYENENQRQSLEELHKNFGIGFSNLDNRRVRWADNGDLT